MLAERLDCNVEESAPCPARSLLFRRCRVRRQPLLILINGSVPGLGKSTLSND